MGGILTSIATVFSVISGINSIKSDLDTSNQLLLNVIASRLKTDVNHTFLPNAVGILDSFPDRILFENITRPFAVLNQDLRIGIKHLCLKIPPSQRISYEESMKLQYPELDFNVFDLDTYGNRSIPNKTSEVWVSTHTSPPPILRPLGMNWYTIIPDLINEMQDVGHPIVSDLIFLPPLVENTMKRTALIFIKPIYSHSIVIGFILDLVNIGTVIRDIIYKITENVFSVMIFKVNREGELDPIFDLTKDPELDNFVTRVVSFEDALDRGQLSISSNIVIGDVTFFSVISTNEKVSMYNFILPISLGIICMCTLLLFIRSREKESIHDKSIGKLKLEEIDRKCEFLAEMTHELRTPLNGILGMTDMINLNEIDSETAECVLHIRMGGNMLKGIINNLLEFSKVEAGKLNCISHSQEIRENIATTCGLVVASYMKPRTSAETVELILNIDETVPLSLYLDHARMTQVLINLVNNSSKFTDEGKIFVHVRASRITHEDNVDIPSYLNTSVPEDVLMIHMSVADTGIGMSGESMERLFRAFSQVHIDRQVGGSGLGLVVCKKVCQLMGGTITCESTIDKGSTFYSSFIARRSDSYHRVTPPFNRRWDMTETMSKNITGTNSNCSTGISILIVDDVYLNRRLISKKLEKRGITAVECSNGKEALESTRETKFDLIFMDYHMPVMSGPSAVRILREETSNMNQNTEVIALTGTDTEFTRKEIKDSGINSILQKPFDLKELEWIINRLKDKSL